jgi:hypothetical protein
MCSIATLVMIMVEVDEVMNNHNDQKLLMT